MTVVKPMLAGKATDELLHKMLDEGPLLVSAKLDGVRGLVVNGQLVSRSLKPIRNPYVQARFGRPEYEGMDGELISGPPNASDVYRVTNSVVMRGHGEPDVTFHVFDNFTDPARPFQDRRWGMWYTAPEGGYPNIYAVVQCVVSTFAELEREEAAALDAGYEGLMVRHPEAPYKFGRSSPKEGFLLKLKRFSDSEAVVIEVIEEMHNTNTAQVNELGQAFRPTDQSGLVGKGTLGALRVRDIHTGQEFKIGTGFSKAQRETMWTSKLMGRVVKYKFFSIGVKDLPRHPVFIGWRHPEDM